VRVPERERGGDDAGGGDEHEEVPAGGAGWGEGLTCDLTNAHTLAVALADAIVDPDAVMVHVFHARVAFTAVLRTRHLRRRDVRKFARET